MRKNKVYRVKVGLDTMNEWKNGESFIRKDAEHQSTAGKENKYEYLQNYGIEYEIPSIYIMDSKFFIKNPKYTLKLIHHIQHDNDKIKNLVHNQNGRH